MVTTCATELLGRVGPVIPRLSCSWHAARTTAAAGTSDAFMRARRFDSLNVNGIGPIPACKKAASFDSGSIRWRPGGHGDQGRVSPVALRHRLSAGFLLAATTSFLSRGAPPLTAAT